MFRLVNFSRNVGGNLIRSSLREDYPKPGPSSAPQFLFWFNEIPGLYTPVPISPLASLAPRVQHSNSKVRSSASQKDLVPFKDFTEHHDEDGNFNATPLYNTLRVLHYGALLAAGYHIFHDKTLTRAIQEWSVKLHPLDLLIPEVFESNCPILAVKHQKTALAQPLDRQESRDDCCATACSHLSVDDIFENEKDIFKEPSATSDYSSNKSEASSSCYQYSKEELHLLQLQGSTFQAVDALVAIRLVKKGCEEGLEQLIQLSNIGCSTSQFFLGQAYEQGRGVDRDMITATKYYKEAAHSGHPEAKYNLGIFYLKGEGGCECSEEKGFELIQEAAECGLSEAVALTVDNVEKQKMETPALEMIEVEQLFHMGEVMEESELIDSVDQLFALELFRVAAQNGHKLAESKFKNLSQRISTRSDASSI